MAFLELLIELVFGLFDRSFVPLGVFASRLVTGGRPRREPKGVVGSLGFGCLGLALLIGGALGVVWVAT